MDERLCINCNRPGHIKRCCPEPCRPERGRGGGGLAIEVVGNMPASQRGGLQPETAGMPAPDWFNPPPMAAWIINSGGSHHMKGNVALLEDRMAVDPLQINMTDGTNTAAVLSGTVQLHVWAADGSTTRTLHGVLHVPGMEVNLFSVQPMMERG